MARTNTYPVVLDINFTTAETSVSIADCYKLIILPTKDCSVSFNDNTHYKKYPSGVAIPIELNSEISVPITKIYVKGTTESGVCGIWGYA